ncbi:DNA double-strand break repair Rad50 ATPase [Rhodovulum sp. P5]|uniref:AAA family ATPase n=1 Tax=Rhodovulum sp. P5 TaxID=1564506 RepID=UPI0009C29437|nr:ATP-binding protein [Rhodovulum sp. P5]ARE39234.1 DNA double-strand break repair Rad50 ATPase [Rhodovulum sp. P5]
MKLRSIALTNVRRFAGQTARIEDIGDGLTVLSAPNETGKSTVFDALHALFFQPHGSANKEIKALRPHSGGGVTVAADIETVEGMFRIEKTWLAKRAARVTDTATGRVVAQDDEAEAWIDRLVTGGLGGPAGLLWVRQGAAALGAEGAGAASKRDWDTALEARRTLMSTLAGEIDMMTGGRRMDTVMQACGSAYDALATSTGRPKAGGPWKQAEDEAEDLRAACADLDAKVAELGEDLAERRTAEAERARLTDPADQKAREAALEAARSQMRAARAHGEKTAQAETAVRVAMLERDASATTLVGLEAQARACTEAEAAVEAAMVEDRQAEDAFRQAQEAEAAARQAQTVAETGVARLRQSLDRAEKAARAKDAAVRLADLRQRLDTAEEQAKARAAAQARVAATKVTEQALRAIETAADEVRSLLARRDALAVTVVATYAGAGRIFLNGTPLPDGQPVPLHEPVTLDVPDIGRLDLDPGGRGVEAGLSADLARAEAHLDDFLRKAGVHRLAEARAAHAARRTDQGVIEMANRLLENLAPHGVEALRAEIADLAQMAEDGAAAEPGDPVALADALKGAVAEFEDARNLLESERNRLTRAETALAEARTGLRLAKARLTDAEEARGPQDQHAARIEEARMLRVKLDETLEKATRDHRRLMEDAPDIAMLEAELARTEGVVRNAEERLKALSERIFELDGLIRARAEDGVEERLSDLRGRLELAEARAARYAREVRALARLRAALEDARRAARDTYFEPVKRELLPLLALIHDAPDLTLDDTTLLPSALTRNGQAEDIGILSGGTAEQVAILTRLAFARLYARAGQSVPVILDDALVHSDDDRIERMFTALHHVAADQQILVFTCRQRAFSRLGGTEVPLVIERA